jgi:hypothetical protein
MQTFVLQDAIPSGSHNSSFSFEHGQHWPAGTRFTRISQVRVNRLRKSHCLPADIVVLEQIDGEQVRVTMPPAFFKAHFVQEAPRLMLFGVEEVNVGAVVITAD